MSHQGQPNSRGPLDQGEGVAQEDNPWEEQLSGEQLDFLEAL